MNQDGFDGTSILDNDGSSSIYWGTNIICPIWVEIIPIVLSESQPQPSLTAFTCKRKLEKITLSSTLWKGRDNVLNKYQIEWDKGSNKSQINNLSMGYLFYRTKTDNADDNISEKDIDVDDDNKKTISNLRASFIGEIQTFPIVYLTSDDPTEIDPVPTCVTCYCKKQGSTEVVPDMSDVIISDSTLVKISNPKLASLLTDDSTFDGSSPPTWYVRESLLRQASGELAYNKTDAPLRNIGEQFVNQNYDEPTIHQLTNVLTSQLSRSLNVGTTSDALKQQSEHISRLRRMKKAIKAHMIKQNIIRPQDPAKRTTGFKSGQDKNDNNLKSIADDMKSDIPPTLLIVSSDIEDGKGTLARVIAKRVGYDHVHVIQPATLLAKYGTNLDAAIESMLHSIVIDAAVTNKSVCIVMDNLDLLLPTMFVGRGGTAGDAAVPVLNATASLLKNVSKSIERARLIPYPTRNPLYGNVNPGSNAIGSVLKAKICIVGTVTDQRASGTATNPIQLAESGGSTLSKNFDLMAGQRIRVHRISSSKPGDNPWDDVPVQQSSASTENDKQGDITATQDSDKDGTSTHTTSIGDEGVITDGTSVDENFPSQDQTPNRVSEKNQMVRSEGRSNIFLDAVGGCFDAKRELIDVLSLDERKIRMLSRFNIFPPIGVLFYGPPGCGKTLLAKAVAKMVRSEGRTENDTNVSDIGDASSQLPGCFLSLQSSDIVRGEIGTSEKLLLAAFDYAIQHTPAVILLDELQALSADRNTVGSGKLTSVLIQCFDKIGRWYTSGNGTDTDDGDGTTISDRLSPQKRIVVLGATNSKWMIDSALLRPGRFDRNIYIGLPDENDRESILFFYIQKMRLANHTNIKEGLCKRLALHTDGYSSAKLAALCKAAATNTFLDEGENGTVKEKHFMEAIELNTKRKKREDKGMIPNK